MNTQPEVPETVVKKILRFIWKAVPFVVMVLIVGIIILFLGRTIAAKKAELVKQKSREQTAVKPLTNVVTLQIIPGMIKEKLSLPGVAKPWISLEVVSEIKGKIVNKKTDQGRRVNKGDILAVIDKRDYQNAHDSALASYESALATQKRLKALVKKNFVTQSNIDDVAALVKTSKAAYENAKLDLSRCLIRSPMKGVVNRVYIENGKFLNSGDPVVQILQLDKLKIEVGIPESDVDAVRKLKNFDMTIDALKGKTCKGEYHYLYKTTDSMARLYNLEIKVDNKEGLILPDMFVRVEIIKHQNANGIAVPMYSLVKVNNRVGVYVENRGVAQFTPVQSGFQAGWQTQIIKGLDPGDRVVVVGHRIIEHDQKIKVIKNIMDIEELTQ
ncbi:MAG: efflux RND transporter periplasmic adaptor subunit [Desulfobacula sp.]|nr:efflux RND transporter periplasmic adaptor subunit [Desulfobacula sp.]